MPDLDSHIQMIEHEGYTLTQLMQYIAKRKTRLMQLNDAAYKKFCGLMNQLDKQKVGDCTRGELLEQIISTIFDDGYRVLVECRKNCRTSSNEIDLLLSWTENAKFAGFCDVYPCFGEMFLCECKNYTGKVSVTFVGKFYSLLKISGCKFGILISIDGVTGKGKWDAGQGLIKKIALKDDIYIIDLNLEDLKKIQENEGDIFHILYEKWQALRMDIDYSKYISAHENQKAFANDSICDK